MPKLRPPRHVAPKRDPNDPLTIIVKALARTAALADYEKAIAEQPMSKKVRRSTKRRR